MGISLRSLLLAAGLIILSGCAGTQPPVIPADTNSPGQGLQSAADDVLPGLTAASDSSVVENAQYHYLWLYQEVLVDPVTLDFEIIPTRVPSGHWNILTWLENGPCTNCFKLKGITPTPDSTLLCDIEILHPFSDPKLTGFDVRGIAMFAGSETFPVSGLIASNRASGDGEVVNADGYTTLYNWTTEGSGPAGLQGYMDGKLATPTLPSATLNAYKRFISDDVANTRNAFYAGQSVTETFEIDMPDSAFIFGYAVDASWVPASIQPVTDPMTDFPAEANCPEPWKVEVTDIPVGDGLTSIGGSTVLTIDVYDHGGKESYSAPVVECEYLFDGVLASEWVSDGDGLSTFEVAVNNETLAGEGEYRCLVSVVDNENSSSPEWLDLTAYQIAILTVSEKTDDLPVAMASAEPTEQTVCEDIVFADDGSYDPDGGDIQLYEWDWDNDGTFDETGAEVSHSWDWPGTYEIQFRVTDDESNTSMLDTPIEVTIVNALPTAVAEVSQTEATPGTEIEFDGAGSHDNDCGNESITEYAWDWDNNGAVDEIGDVLTHSWDENGTYYVNLRVRDDEGYTNELDEPIEITITNEPIDPIATASAGPLTQTVCEPVQFSDDGSYDPDGGLITLYEWDWNNDGTYDDTGDTISHSFDTVGIHPVQFRVTDDEGATDTLDSPIEITVENALPIASATSDTEYAFTDVLVQFDASDSTDGDCSGESIVLYEWDFDFDGAFNMDDTGMIVGHSWASEGSYNVQLRVTDDEGATDMLDVPLEITVGTEYFNPIAYATVEAGPHIVCEDITFADDGSYDPDGGLITLYEWDWNNDGTYDDTGDVFNHSWDTPGTYYVQFRVTDDEGSTDTLATPLIMVIGHNDPTASANVSDTEVYVDESVTFNGTGSTDNDCSGDSIVLWEWDFEYSGVFSADDTGSIVSHSYSTPGDYSVQLRVTDNEGGTDLLDTPLAVTVVNQAPEISITNCPSVDVNTSSYDFEWTASDDVDDPSSMQYNVSKDGIWQGWATGLSEYTWQSISSGPHTLIVQVRDLGDPQLTDQDTCIFNANFKPSVSIDNCPDTTIVVDHYTFNWTGTDDLSSEAEMSYSWKLDSGSWSAWTLGQLSVELTGLSDSTHTFYIRVKDTGNPELTCETAPSTCDSCEFTVDTSCSQPPVNVMGFTATDADGILSNREVRLEWTLIEQCVDYYDIQKAEWSEADGWHWVDLITVDSITSAYIDTDARYCGSANPIEYRIRARNANGTSPEWSTDTGYPKTRKIAMSMWCAADDSSGTNAVVDWTTTGLADFNSCNEFWIAYGLEFVLENSGGFFWMTTAEYRNLTGGEDTAMHGIYGQAQEPDTMNVYYVQSSYGSTTRGYARTMCPGSFNTTENIFIVLCEDNHGSGDNVNYICLAHECGHSIGRFIDIYLLDLNHNMVNDDGAVCADIQTFCNTPPTNIPPLFCDEDGFYPEEPNSFGKIPKQLMYYSFLGCPVSDYDILPSQYFWFDEWLHGNESNYPVP